MGELSNHSNAGKQAEDRSRDNGSAMIESITDRQQSEQLEVSEFCVYTNRMADISAEEQCNASHPSDRPFNKMQGYKLDLN